MLHIDESSVQILACPTCGVPYDRVSGFVSDASGPLAVYFAMPHGGGRAAWLDVILGTWGTPEPVADHVNFAGLLETSGLTIVDAPVAGNPGGLFGGIPLVAADALAHPLLAAFREVAALISEDDRLVRGYLSASALGHIHQH